MRIDTLSLATKYHGDHDTEEPEGLTSSFILPRQTLLPLDVANGRSGRFCRSWRLGRFCGFDPPSTIHFRHSRYRQTWFNAPPRAIGGIAAACAVTYETIARGQAAAKKRGGRAAARSRSETGGIIRHIKEDNSKVGYAKRQQRLMGAGEDDSAMTSTRHCHRRYTMIGAKR